MRGGVERRQGWSSKASEAEFKGVEVCASGLKPRDPGRRDAPGEKVLEDRRSPRRRGRTGTGARTERASAGINTDGGGNDTSARLAM
eukprot:30970-Pelagococcus_subviridis.AAC.5